MFYVVPYIYSSGMIVNHGKIVIGSVLQSLSTTISMKRSRRELLIDMVVDRGIFKNNQITHALFYVHA